MVRWDFWILRDPLVPDDPVRVEHEDRPFRHALQAETPEAIVEHPVRRADFLVPVAQQRVVEVILFLEDAMAVVTVRADAEHLRTPLLEVSHRVAHRAELALAHVREVPDVEGQDHRAAAELVRDRDGLAFVAEHREVRRLLADIDHPCPTAVERRGGGKPFPSALPQVPDPGREVNLTVGNHYGPPPSRGNAELNPTPRSREPGAGGNEWRETCPPPISHSGP